MHNYCQSVRFTNVVVIVILLLLWPPYLTGQVITFLPCGFFLSSFFPRLISAVAE